MRSITITYQYSGDEAPWRAAIDTFIAALDADPMAKSFSYQVGVADDGITRIHWGRWDTPETLKHVQSQDYFADFAPKVRAFGGETLGTTGTDILAATGNWGAQA